jgi:hypothetical protein
MDRLHPDASRYPRLRIRFNLATALCAITVIALLCGVACWERDLLYRTVVPSILVATSCSAAHRPNNADLCWSLWSAAWLIAGLYFVSYVFDQFNVLGYPTSRDRRGLFLLGYVSINVVPAFLSIPAIFLAIRKATGQPSSARKYIVATGVLAIINMTISVVLLELLFQYDFPLL